jgi:hypothetical protein
VSTFAIQFVGIALVAIHLRAPLKASVATLVASTFFIPGAILFPDAPAYLFVLRLGLWAAALGMFVRAGTGEIPSHALRPSRVLVAFSVFVAVAYAFGVAGGAYPSQSERAFELWLLLVDQLLFLWVATIAVRVLGVRFVAFSAFTGVVGVALIAIGERITGASYAHWWFRHQITLGSAGSQLETRGGTVRVRATAEFALQFAWVLAFFVPLLSVYALRAKRVVTIAVPAIVTLAIVLTITRSVFSGLAAGAVCVLVFARGDSRVGGAIVIAGVLAGAVYVSSVGVRQPYQAADPESEAVRERRLVILTNELTQNPWTGLGLDGATQRDILSTDSAVLATYAGVGVIGVAALAAAVGAAAATAIAAAIVADAAVAPVAGAVLGGLAAGVLGMFAFDSLSGSFASWNLWLLAAFAVGLYEEAEAARPGRLRPRLIHLSRRRLILPAAGLACGLVVYAAAPSHTAVQLRIFTLSPQYLSTLANGKADFVGRVLVQATCDSVDAALAAAPVRFDCFDPLTAGPGTGLVRIEARDRRTLNAATATFSDVTKRVHRATRISALGAPQRARPTWARTAPLVGVLLFGEAALLLPSIRFRRRRLATASRSRERERLAPAYR